MYIVSSTQVRRGLYTHIRIPNKGGRSPIPKKTRLLTMAHIDNETTICHVMNWLHPTETTIFQRGCLGGAQLPKHSGDQVVNIGVFSNHRRNVGFSNKHEFKTWHCGYGAERINNFFRFFWHTKFWPSR